METLKQNVQAEIIGAILYLNTWLWAVTHDTSVSGIIFSNWLLGIASVLIFGYLMIDENENKEDVADMRMLGRIIGTLLIFTNLIYMFNMEISRMHVLAAIIFLLVIVLIYLYYKKYGFQTKN